MKEDESMKSDTPPTPVNKWWLFGALCLIALGMYGGIFFKVYFYGP